MNHEHIIYYLLNYYHTNLVHSGCQCFDVLDFYFCAGIVVYSTFIKIKYIIYYLYSLIRHLTSSSSMFCNVVSWLTIIDLRFVVILVDASYSCSAVSTGFKIPMPPNLTGRATEKTNQI